MFQNTKEARAGKLGPTWEGPYQVTKVMSNGAYKLQTKEGRSLNNSWNAVHLKLYYFQEVLSLEKKKEGKNE